MGVYLLHFEPRYKHAGHYLGYADVIEKRVCQHRAGTSKARLVEAAVRAGVNLYLARTWEGDRKLERKLKDYRGKRTGSLARLCPICKQLKKGVYLNVQ